MALTLPSGGYSGLDIKPDLGMTFRRSEGGLLVTSRRVDPYFAGRITTGDLAPSEHADYRAFLSVAVDTNTSISFVHPRGRWPRAYASASAYPGPATAIVDHFGDLRTPVVANLVNGTIYKRGDLVAFIQGDLRVPRWIAQDVTVSSFLAQEIPITPRLPIGLLSPNCQIRFIDPTMLLRVVPGSWDVSETYQAKPISFQVAEALA